MKKKIKVPWKRLDELELRALADLINRASANKQFFMYHGEAGRPLAIVPGKGSMPAGWNSSEVVLILE